MRKILVTVASLIMTLVMSMSFLGCNLVTTDNAKNMNQVIATVQITEDAPVDKIYKKEIVMSYLNYGYIYEQNYGYTRDQVMKLIIDQLITTRVYVQHAIVMFGTTDENNMYYGNVVNKDKGVWDLERYLTEDEIIDAVYSAKKDMNAIIKSYAEIEDETATDTIVGTVRVVPSNAANKERELSNQQKKDYKIDTNSTSEIRKGYNKVITLLEQNELLGDYNGDITTTTYYKQTLKSYQENTILEKFDKAIANSARKGVSFEQLKEVYADNFKAQSEMTEAEIAQKIESATIEDPVLIGTNGSYGYVYNLLLGASTAQTDKIKEIETKDINQKAIERKAILDKTIIKDLRTTWLYSGFDFDTATGCFTGDYTLAKDSANSLPFQGKVTHLNADKIDEEDYQAKYRIDSVTEFTVDSFIEMMDKYVYGSVQANAKTSSDSVSVYKKAIVNQKVNEYDAKINELLFAFSTDDGSLNTYKGYTIAPIPDTGSETYVQEFADAGRELITLGGNSYIIVGTDYGYHVMFYSQAFGGSEGYADLISYLNFAMGETGNEAFWKEKLAELIKNWDEDDLDTNNFLYKFFNSVASVRVEKVGTKIQQQLQNDYIYGEGDEVTRYPDRYADLLEA